MQALVKLKEANAEEKRLCTEEENKCAEEAAKLAAEEAKKAKAAVRLRGLRNGRLRRWLLWSQVLRPRR